MIRKLIAPVFVFTATLLPAAPVVPLVNLVDDQTLFALSVTDAPALLRGWESSPLATTWNDPQVVKFLAPLREKLEVAGWDEEMRALTGLTLNELLAMAEGEMLFALPTVEFSSFDSNAPLPFLVAIEVDGNQAKIEKILTDLLAKDERVKETEVFSGTEVHTCLRHKAPEADGNADTAVAPSTISWAMVEGIWVISASKERVFAAIDAVKQGGVDAALGKSERFLRTRQRAGGAQTLAYINMPAIHPLLRDAVRMTKSKSAGALNPMGLDAEVVFNALGLDVFDECYLALAIDDDETRMNAGIAFNEERGLIKLAAYEPGRAVQPDWIPAKWPSVSTARFNVAKAYAGLEELLASISPMLLGLVDGRIHAFNKQLNIDLKRDVIGSFGDDLVSAYAIPPGLDPGEVPAWEEMDQLISLSLSNQPALIKSIDAFKHLAGPAAEKMLIEREYLGNMIYTLNLPTAPGAEPTRGVTYAIANDTLLIGIGSPATVENALQGMASGEGGFWKRDDVRAALADLPGDAIGIQVQDLRVLMASVIETAVQFQELANSIKSDEEKKQFVDVSARPDADVIARHWGLATGYSTRTSDGIFSTTRLAHPQK